MSQGNYVLLERCAANGQSVDQIDPSHTLIIAAHASSKWIWSSSHSDPGQRTVPLC